MKNTYLFAVALCIFSFNVVDADSVLDITPDGLIGFTGQNPANNYLGVVTSSSPLQIGVAGSNVAINSIIAQTANVNDVIGRDQISPGNFFSGSEWSYSVELPKNGDPAFGLTDVSFNADIFFSATNFERRDQLVFELFLNDVSVGIRTIEGLDGGGSIDLQLTPDNKPAFIVSEARVVVDSGFFNSSDESFLVSNAGLQASYQVAIPEPGSVSLLPLLALFTLRRRRAEA